MMQAVMKVTLPMLDATLTMTTGTYLMDQNHMDTINQSAIKNVKNTSTLHYKMVDGVYVVTHMELNLNM